MNKLFQIFVFSKLLIIVLISNSFSASTTGAADVYKVTMKKVELCTASTSVTDCENPIVIGNTEKTVDIAATDAGSAAANYGDPALLPLGETYTHMRVTIDRKFTIKADLEVTGVTANCATTAALSGSAYPGGSLSSNEKYDRTPVIDDGGTAAEADLYLKNDQMKLCGNTECGAVGLSDAQTVTYDQGSISTFQTQHADGSTSDDHVMVYELTAPYTVALIAPVIDISFGTSTAIKASEHPTQADLCYFEPQEPNVTITIK